jgi:hypothetical protein
MPAKGRCPPGRCCGRGPRKRAAPRADDRPGARDRSAGCRPGFRGGAVGRFVTARTTRTPYLVLDGDPSTRIGAGGERDSPLPHEPRRERSVLWTLPGVVDASRPHPLGNHRTVSTSVHRTSRHASSRANERPDRRRVTERARRAGDLTRSGLIGALLSIPRRATHPSAGRRPDRPSLHGVPGGTWRSAPPPRGRARPPRRWAHPSVRPRRAGLT